MMSIKKGTGEKFTCGTYSAMRGKRVREIVNTRAVFTLPGLCADNRTGIAPIKPATRLVTTRNV